MKIRLFKLCILRPKFDLSFFRSKNVINVFVIFMEVTALMLYDMPPKVARNMLLCTLGKIETDLQIFPLRYFSNSALKVDNCTKYLETKNVFEHFTLNMLQNFYVLTNISSTLFFVITKK